MYLLSYLTYWLLGRLAVSRSPHQNQKTMTFEEAQDMYMLYTISPELSCTCDEVHICQQCMLEDDDLIY